MPISIKQTSPAAPTSKVNQYPAQPPNSPPVPLDPNYAHLVNEADEYEVLSGGKAEAKKHSNVDPLYAVVKGPGAARLSTVQFATASNTSITPYNGAYVQSAGSGSPSRRRIFTNDGSIGIRG
ncbi:MAG TPA: hypothetical protein PLX89_22380 [Verrucomicrobiota bacterium]|nr:hypothetical protein [Verrucomicrobiales bacterium]HRI15753.1 hypothetical protein [Verrucomicrobiota bacterium]